MKVLSLLVLSMMFVSCASQSRGIASPQEEARYEKIERQGQYSMGYHQ